MARPDDDDFTPLPLIASSPRRYTVDEANEVLRKAQRMPLADDDEVVTRRHIRALVDLTDPDPDPAAELTQLRDRVKKLERALAELTQLVTQDIARRSSG